MSLRRSLSPNQKISIIVASIALLLAAETGGLFVLSQQQPASPAVPSATDSPAPATPGEPSATLPPKPTDPAPVASPPAVFTVPSTSPATPGASAQPGIDGSALAPAPLASPNNAVGGLATAPIVPGANGKNGLAGKTGAKESPQKAEARVAFQAGIEALKKNDKATALRSFERVVSLVPDHLPSHLNLSALYLDSKQPQKALPHLQKAAQIDPKSAAARFNLARTLLALRRPKEALAPLRETVRLAPNEREGHALLAQVLIATRQPKEAYKQWVLLAERDKRDVVAHLTAAALANDVLNQPKTAEKWLRQSITGSPRDPQAALMLGRLLLAQSKVKAAIPVLTAATKARPDVFEFYPLLANARGATGDTKGAISAIQSALLRLPVGKSADEKARIAFTEGGLRMTLGQTYGNARQPKAALAEFQKAARLRPSDPQPRSLAALASLQLKDATGATKLLQDALRLDPKRANDRRMLAQIFVDGKRWKDADAQLALYARAQPKDVNALLLWAQVARTTKDAKRETEIVRQITTVAPNNPLGWTQLGILQREAGQTKAALASFKKLAALRPGDPSPPFEMARLQTELRDFDAAFASWQKVVSNKPAYAPAYSSLLLAGDQANERSTARAFLVRQMSGRAENVDALKEVLSFYEGKKRSDEAKAFLNDLVARNPKFQAAKAALDSFNEVKATPAKPEPKATP